MKHNHNRSFRLHKWALLLIVIQYCSTAFTQNFYSAFTFNLKSNCTTSAGVFKNNGQLIRTLWSNRAMKAGIYTEQWDRKDDYGRLVRDTNYFIRVISNNLKYTWEGVIGNNSDSLTGSSKIRAFNRFNSMAIAGEFAYYSIGYSEGIPSSYKFNLKHPRNKINILDEHQNNTDLQCNYVCTDGQLVYWTGYDPFNPLKSFVFATKCSNDSEYIFNRGIASSTFYGRNYKSVLNLRTQGISSHPSGLAVQKKGKYLVVAHSNINLLIIYDKVTGDSLFSIQISKPREICFDTSEYLWVISGQSDVIKYEILSSGNLSVPLLTIPQLNSPLALAVSPNNYKLMVIEGGTSQQIKVFSNYSGKLLTTLGTPGGYTLSSEVNDYKFYFSDSVTQLTKPFIAFEPDSSFWVGDVGNERVQKYNHLGIFEDRIMCLPHSYSTVVDQNNPSRVMCNYLEFEVDYSKPLKPDNGSWRLKRNWRAFIKAPYFQSDELRVFRQMTTLTGNRTFAFLDSIVNGTRYPVLVELPENGVMLYHGQILQAFGNDIIEKEGHLRRYSSSYNKGDIGYIIQKRFMGYSAGKPVWGTDDTLSKIPLIDSLSPAYLGLAAPAVSKNFTVLFNPSKDHKGFHLGGIKTGDTTFNWLSSPSTYRTYTGDMPKDGRFDIGNNVEYAGGGVYAIDTSLFWNYHGEFWKNSQTNIWHHYHECGLMLAQFGITTPDGERISKEAFPMGAGNVFSSTLVKVGTNLYIYHNDESVHGGVHRWRIDGMTSIDVQTIRFNHIKINKKGLKGAYFRGNQIDPLQLVSERIDANIHQLSLPKKLINSTDYKILHTGYLLSDTSGLVEFKWKSVGQTRLWLMDSLIVDNNVNGTNSFKYTLEQGQYYTIRLESSDIQNELSWVRQSGTTPVPSSQLSPDISMNSTGINLMYGLQNGYQLQNNQFGWTYTPDNSNAKFTAYNGRNIQIGDKFDLYLSSADKNNSFSVKRNLKDVALCHDYWSISGLINFGKCQPESQNGGLSLLIKDSSGKILVSIRYEVKLLPEYQYPTSLTCNGESIINAPYNNISYYLSQTHPFKIGLTGEGVQFEFGSLIPMTVPYKDLTADWQNAGTLEIAFEPHSDDGIREISLADLKLEGNSEIKIMNWGRDTICLGESSLLQADKLLSYKWSNNFESNPIIAEQTGQYYLKFPGNNTCNYRSDTIHIVLDNTKAQIVRNGDILSIPAEVKSQKWYLNNQLISEKKTITLKEKGRYSLMIETASECEDSTSIFIDELSTDAPVLIQLNVYPNPAQYTSPIHLHISENCLMQIYTDNSMLLYQRMIESGDFEIESLNRGIYFLKFTGKTQIMHYKLIVL